MSKQYGLVLPGQQKNKPVPIQKPSRVFDESSSESDGNAPPQMIPSKSGSIYGSGAMERRIARKVQEKALAEDPTVYQYDELYDDMDNKREEQKLSKAQEPKKPKYITRLLETAERRKLENELRVERQVQKEREAEGEQFKDKESFVTSGYRKKLEELRELQEKDKREEYLEAIGDVTKQKDLDGFYRHLYEQKLGKPDHKSAKTSGENEEISYKPIKSEKSLQQPHPQQRAYRKRHSSDDEDEASKSDEGESKKVHLQNNIDADSDFSIDSSSSMDEEEEKISKQTQRKRCKKESQRNDNEDDMKKNKVFEKSDSNILEHVECEKQKSDNEDIKGDTKKLTVKPPPKPKIDIWKKRTVGEVFDAAVQRYYERKAARSAA